jgi:hypothetical protein
MPTHLGQDVDDHVVLVALEHKGGSSCDTLSFKEKALFRVLPDGEVEPKPFKVPKGRFLVVTDVEWSSYGGPNGTNDLKANRTLRLSIHIGNNKQISDNPSVFQSSLTIDQATMGGRPGKSEYLTAGFVVAAGTRICPNVVQAEPDFFATVFIDTLILRGYLLQGK